jgi:phosphate transport system ATP-binding protein
MSGAAAEVALHCEDVSIFYGDNEAIKSVSLDIPARRLTAFIGPSGCGKSTLLRAYDRMNDTIPGTRWTGRITLFGTPIETLDPVVLRRRVGMVFQKPNPFPLSIFDNVAFGLRIGGIRKRDELASRVEAALRGAALWEEVADRLEAPALGLSGGQQQRLCIARALAVEPEVLLMDEPTSALDPGATRAVEALMTRLAERYTLVVVTHNMQQARRVAHETAMFYLGELVEHAPTDRLFDDPQDPRARDYVRGAFG